MKRKSHFDELFEDPEIAYNFCRYLKFNNIPQEVINTISKNSVYSYKFAKELGFNLHNIPGVIFKRIVKKIPKRVIREIARDSKEAYVFADKVDFDLDCMPQEIIKSISKNPNLSYIFAGYLNNDINKIPKSIILGIFKDENYTYHFLGYIHRKLDMGRNFFKKCCKDPNKYYKILKKAYNTKLV